MNKNKIFFGENGLTSTSANHIANLAKEAYSSLVEELDSLQLYDEDISLLGSGAFTPIRKGATAEDIERIPEMIAYIAALKSLIAWLREAIKARKTLSEELENVALDKWCEEHGFEFPEAPVRDHILTEDEYYGSLSIKERNAYYQLETKCATLGAFIHNNGTLSTARKRFAAVVNKPTIVHENGRDTVITARKASVSLAEVEDLFFRLQAKHREYQAALNSIKHKCELAIESAQLAADAKYREELATYQAHRQELQAQFTEWKHEQAIALQALKIVIPDSLKPVYEKVSSLGK